MVFIWKHRCAWRNEILDVGDVQVDHFIPTSLSGDALTNILRAYSLPDDFDRDSIENWSPMHGRCNRQKSDRVYVPNGWILGLHQNIIRKAPSICSKANVIIQARRLDDSVRFIEAADFAAMAPKKLAAWRPHIAGAALSAGVIPGLVRINDYPGVKQGVLFDDALFVIDADRHGGELTFWVTDGTRNGYAGTHDEFMCGICNLHTMWNGKKCVRCRPPMLVENTTDDDWS